MKKLKNNSYKNAISKEGRKSNYKNGYNAGRETEKKWNNKDVLVAIRKSVVEIDSKIGQIDSRTVAFERDIKSLKENQEICSGEIRRLSLLLIGDPNATDEKKQIGIMGRIRDTEHWKNSFEKKQKNMQRNLWTVAIAFGGYLAQIVVQWIVKIFSAKPPNIP